MNCSRKFLLSVVNGLSYILFYKKSNANSLIITSLIVEIHKADKNEHTNFRIPNLVLSSSILVIHLLRELYTWFIEASWLCESCFFCSLVYSGESKSYLLWLASWGKGYLYWVATTLPSFMKSVSILKTHFWHIFEWPRDYFKLQALSWLTSKLSHSFAIAFLLSTGMTASTCFIFIHSSSWSPTMRPITKVSFFFH